MTFAEFMKDCQEKQRAYIRAEKARMAKAAKLVEKYRNSMAALGLHPLSWSEIVDRTKQLDDMTNRVLETYGDTPSMRAAFTMQVPQ